MNGRRLLGILGLCALLGVLGMLARRSARGPRVQERPPQSAGLIRSTTLAPVKNQSQPRGAGASVRSEGYEAIMDRFFRSDPVAEAQAAINRMADEFNAWVKEGNAKFQREQQKLKGQFETVRQLGEQIKQRDAQLADQKPNPTNKVAVEAYNARVTERNGLAARQKELYESCQQDQETLKEAVKRFEKEVAVRQDLVESAKEEAKQNIEAHRDWFARKQDLAFSTSLNRSYTQLHQERGRLGQSAELDARIEKLRAMRHELGEHVLRQQKGRREGFVFVRATLCGKEESLLLVDTGAAIVTISPCLVAALGLTDRLGKEIELALPGGVRITGPELVIPRISVFGKEAANVKAVVLNESQAGIDGLLGLSFLDRFSFRIDKEQTPSLILEPLRKD